MDYIRKALDDLDLNDLRQIRERILQTKVNVLLVGGSGVGKSSTINALFQSHGLKSNAKIGQGTEPETKEISHHEIDNLVIWDTPGLGDSTQKDEEHQKKIVDLLHKKDDKGQPLIDLIFLILDASSRDFSSAFSLIRETLLPNLHDSDRNRILVGLNQADLAMKGHYWNHEDNKPEDELVERLEDLVDTVRIRIKADTGLQVDPIYYSAGCTIDDKVLSNPYNLQKLLSFIMERLPNKKRAAIALHINEDESNFRDNDNKEDYQEKINKNLLDSMLSFFREVASDVAERVKEIITDPENIRSAAVVAFNFFMASIKKR
ncbi:50S ribosome-binding GTPase [Alcanivorax marinus]|uniref:50S ribosome-binding GTPase n=1 Tax=Alloalcanivorax marinus TaxID=1177169 RepID=A0A9Q3UHI8_9GAMM|nr:GTPase [Alloalcanivorax marinus]MCC4307107.1 50S ribosome-binding GTPase [Alloalcanivorax marinus]|tara:strand:- start:3342 stop:4298 length:957 start_codon:yes stop_codon:yes gene_type:complete